MNSKAMQCFESKCGKVRIFIDNDTPIGLYHDFLVEQKGLMVDRMIAAHKEQLAEMEAQKQQDLSCDGECA